MGIDIDRIARLARLKIDEKDRGKIEQEMQTILDHIGNLPPGDGDISLLDPDNTMELREDVVRSEYNRDELLKCAPEVKAGCAVVPKVVGGSGG